MRRRALDGMARFSGLGDFSAGDAASLITAGTQGAAQIISAENGYPYSPYSSFGATSPYLGYGAPVSPLGLSSTSLLPLLLIAGLLKLPAGAHE